MTEYNAGGKRFKVSKYNGLTGLLEVSTVYEYDASGHLTKASEYDFAGNLKSYVVTSYNAAGKADAVLTYDDTGLLMVKVTMEYGT